ncbi:mRNA binding post-transcriptional regulator [Rhodotorula toruloides]|uniref:mRNA binding post-transcriptional regulator n=1 Tax=Rhodotorula toruloides TaxID=5286 RepID=A0A511KFG4_RHOTO|nr:mRNA binding post-transcriptional regulator [Rhodotorula toruloides]
MSSQQHPLNDASSPLTIPDDPSPHHSSQPPSSSPISTNAPSAFSSTVQQPAGGPSTGETSAANHSCSPALDLPNGVSSGSTPSVTASSRPNDERTPSSASSPRPTAPSRSMSYKAEGDIWGSGRASNAFGGTGDDVAQRTTRAASDGAVLGTGFGGPGSMAFVPSGEPSRAAGGISSRLSSLGSEDSGSGSNNDEQAFFRDYQRRSLEHSASQRLSTAKSFASPPLASARLGPGATSPYFQPPSFLSTTSATASGLTSSASNTPALSIPPPLLSPTSTSPPSSHAPPSVASSMISATSNSLAGSPPESGPAGSKGATLHLGDLDVWMDEAYVRECCSMMGWDVVNVKMSRGASPSSGYCFLTFSSATDASRALTRFNANPPVLMPRSGKTFKLNWGTGLPGSQPTWDGEFSVFVGDLAREVGEADLLALFSPLFPSTKSAKVLCDPSTGLSRGFGFVRFADESDMQRALHLGSNSHSGLLLHGRTIRISEASGSGGPNAVEGLPHLRERTRTRSGDTVFAAQGQQQLAQQQQGQQQQGYFPPYPPQSAAQQNDGFPENPYASPSLSSAAYGNSAAFSSPISPYGAPNPAPNGNGLMSPSLGSGGPGSNVGSQGGRAQREGGGVERNNIPAGSVPPGGDPNNTTVFVGGLPASISEETLRSFFHHFGEITYCKIPPGKGCGFVQFVRRQDAELAIAKMNDFPIHGKSRIRLSWGRSQGDKQVEHVRKLASALGVPFDAVWRMVQGQDNSTIKQIASAVGSNGTGSGGQATGASVRDSAGPNGNSRMDVRAVANAAGLSESEVLDLVKNGNSSNGSNSTSNKSGTSSHSISTAGSNFFARSAALTGSMTSLESATSPASPEPPRGNNPYSRVSPTSFSSAFAPAAMMPLSPPPTAGPGAGSFAHHQASHPPFAPAYPAVLSHSPSPYTTIRPESYLVQPPTASPYERVDFADGGRPSPNGFSDRYQPHAFGPGGIGGGKWQEQPHPDLGMGSNYTNAPPPPGMPLDESFAGLSLGEAGGPPRSLPPPMAMGRPAFQPTAPDFFPGALASPTTTGAGLPALGGEPTWSWNGVSAA